MKAVIQAGGKGTRLRPYTMVMPKPMMPVGDQPVIEILLKWLRRWDVKETYITTGYLSHLIRALCGDGRQWDMSIKYCEEHEPLGTIGPLNNIGDELDETFLVLNGDLITDLDLRSFIAFHRRHDGMISIATFSQNIDIDFGVIHDDQNRITEFYEKPKQTFQVSMGIYCMEPQVLELIPKGVPFGFDNLMHALLANGLPAYTYKHNGLWLDIGQEKDFSHVQEVFQREYKQRVLGA